MNPIVFFISAILLFSQSSEAQSQCRNIFIKSTKTSECTESLDSDGNINKISCDCETKSFYVNIGDSRKVLYRVPSGPVPPGGFPVAFVFQGSFFSVEFARESGLPFGGFNEIRLIQKLLDSGFAVLAPRAPVSLFWETNTPYAHLIYKHTNDYKFMRSIFSALEGGEFGPLNPQRMYATGISSGGYHSSRMAIEFPEKFRAIAIHSASYANFSGLLMPPILRSLENHPPTLFVHGTSDIVVPIESAKPYIKKLNRHGVENKMVEVQGEGHGWFENSPADITNWFLQHP